MLTYIPLWYLGSIYTDLPSFKPTKLIDNEALDILTSYNPATLAIQDLLQQQVQLTRFIKISTCNFWRWVTRQVRCTVCQFSHISILNALYMYGNLRQHRPMHGPLFGNGHSKSYDISDTELYYFCSSQIEKLYVCKILIQRIRSKITKTAQLGSVLGSVWLCVWWHWASQSWKIEENMGKPGSYFH